MRSLLLAALIAGQLTAGAADGLKTGPRSAEETVSMKVEYLTIVLDLDDAQTVSLREIQTNYFAKIDAVRSEYQPVLDELKEGLHEIRNAEETEERKEKKMQAKSLREDFKPELQPLKDAMEAEGDALETEILAILSPAQQEKFRALQTWRQKYPPMKAKAGPWSGFGPAER